MVFAVAQNRTLDESRRRDDVMRINRSLPKTAKTSFETYSDEVEFDRWIECAGSNELFKMDPIWPSCK